MLWEVNGYTMEMENAVIKAIEDGGMGEDDAVKILSFMKSKKLP